MVQLKSYTIKLIFFLSITSNSKVFQDLRLFLTKVRTERKKVKKER